MVAALPVFECTFEPLIEVGGVRKRLKLKFTSEKVDGNRVYQIAGVNKAKAQSRRSKTRPR